MNAKDFAIIAILLIAGTILQYLFSPLKLLLTPDVITAFFCLGIIVIRPKFNEALCIGIAGGFLSMLIPGSIFPWANLVSGPAGAYACYFLSQLLRDRNNLFPLVTTFAATLVSGFVFVLITTIFILDTILTRFSNYGDFVMTYLPIIVGTAVLNAIIVQILFLSSGDTLAKKTE